MVHEIFSESILKGVSLSYILNVCFDDASCGATINNKSFLSILANRIYYMAYVYIHHKRQVYIISNIKQ